MGYLIEIQCECCKEMKDISSTVSRDEHLQGFVDRKSHYLCHSCWSYFYNKGVKFKPEDIKEESIEEEPVEKITSRLSILDLRKD